MKDWWFEDRNLGFEVQVFMVHGLGLSVEGSGFRVQGSRFKVQGSGFRI